MLPFLSFIFLSATTHTQQYENMDQLVIIRAHILNTQIRLEPDFSLSPSWLANSSFVNYYQRVNDGCRLFSLARVERAIYIFLDPPCALTLSDNAEYVT